jgi:general secretion pathway protein H
VSVGKRARAGGFTLLELLTALVIIGIVVTLATLSLGNNQTRQLQEAGDRLAALLDLAREEALFGAQDMALSFWRGGYAFHQIQGQQWAPVMGDSQFRPRELPEGLEFSLYLEGIEAELSSTPKAKPQVFVLSSGEVSPFEVVIETESDDTTLSLSSDALGNVKLHVVGMTE